MPIISVLAPTSSDNEIVARAIELRRAVLTQDLDFSEIVALSGRTAPSIAQLRLSDSTVDNVNRKLELALLMLENDVVAGVIASIGDFRIRVRSLPL